MAPSMKMRRGLNNVGKRDYKGREMGRLQRGFTEGRWLALRSTERLINFVKKN